jgi:group II intron reverse transcriptase/maturase
MFSMEEMLSKKNQREAFSFLKNKKDGMGADGMPLSELEDYWKINSERICSELKKGKYTPGIIKCTEIINNRGKRRVISNLCTVDRFITRLLYQKLRRYISPEFLENSYAYQENKGILNAVQKVQEYISEGSKYTMEIDLKDYFDTIPHEQMMSLIKERITDDRVVDLIYKYMHCSVSQDNEIKEKKKGLVQGNAISTVLSNLYLHSLDQYLQEKEYKWVRFADNINVYCRKENDAICVYNEINIYIKEKLHLTINEKKSGIYPVLDRILLGYKFYKYNGKYEEKKYKYQKTDCFHKFRFCRSV